MNGKRRIVTLSVLLGTLLLSLTLATSAFASPVSSKKAQLREVQAKLQDVYHKVDMAVEKYNQATTQLTTVQEQIKENERLLKVAEYNLDVANQQLSARAENIYKTRDVGVVDVLFAANSFDDLVTQLDLMERLGNSDVDTVKSIAAYQQDIKDRRVKLDADKKAAAKLVAEAAEQKAEVESLQGKLEQMTAGIKADIKRLQEQAAARAQAAADAAAAAQNAGGTSTAAEAAAPSSTPAAPATPPSSASPSATSACPTCTAAPARAASTAPASPCTATRRSASASRTAPPTSSTPARRCRISALQPGDLVFFGSASYSYHVGIYVGGGSMIHAPHTGAVVSYGSISGAWIGGRP